jgi:hypothetical protein
MDDNDMQGWAHQQELEHQEWLEKNHSCSICDSQFSENEGGVTGEFGILPVAFCPTCFCGAVDMVKQLTHD